MKKYVFVKLPDGREVVAQDLRNPKGKSDGGGTLIILLIIGFIIWGIWDFFTDKDDALNTKANEAIAWEACKKHVTEQGKLANPLSNDKNTENSSDLVHPEEIDYSDDYSKKYLREGKFRFRTTMYELRSDKGRLNHIAYPEVEFECVSNVAFATNLGNVSDYSLKVDDIL